MSKERFPMPEPRAALVDGDAVLEFTQPDGEVVGQFNFSKVLRSWFGKSQSQALQVIK